MPSPFSPGRGPPAGGHHLSMAVGNELLDFTLLSGLAKGSYWASSFNETSMYSHHSYNYGADTFAWGQRGTGHPPRSDRSYRQACTEAEKAKAQTRTKQSVRGRSGSLQRAWESDPAIGSRTRALIDRDFNKWRHGSGKVYALRRKLQKIQEDEPGGVLQGAQEMPKGNSKEVPQERPHHPKTVPSGMSSPQSREHASEEEEEEVSEGAAFGVCALLTSSLRVLRVLLQP